MGCLRPVVSLPREKANTSKEKELLKESDGNLICGVHRSNLDRTTHGKYTEANKKVFSGASESRTRENAQVTQWERGKISARVVDVLSEKWI